MNWTHKSRQTGQVKRDGFPGQHRSLWIETHWVMKARAQFTVPYSSTPHDACGMPKYAALRLYARSVKTTPNSDLSLGTTPSPPPPPWQARLRRSSTHLAIHQAILKTALTVISRAALWTTSSQQHKEPEHL